MPRTLVYPCALLAGLALLIAAGCHDPRFDEAAAMRQARIHDLLTRFAEHEREGGARLADMGARIQDEHQYRVELLRRDDQRLRDWVNGDIQRWQANQPAYREELRKLWQGNPQRAWETIPPLLY
ncbi:MAG TPA: hypothetical protein VGM03_18995 [Phycisphaerae bacterium]|jgi:hypothetical protein